MRKARRKSEIDESSHNYWPSFADVMSALVLVLFFLMVLTFIQNILTGDSLKTAKIELADTETRLAQASADLSDAMLKIELAEDELLNLQDEINSAISIIEQKENALAQSQALIDEQNETISLTNASLEEIRQQMQGIALLRMDLLLQVQTALQNSLSQSASTQNTTVNIGDNANIIIGGNFLFAYNSTAINESAKPVLTQLSHAFYEVLEKGNTKDVIDSIIIAGHTDDIGTTKYNWELSTFRAQAVVNYLFKANPKLELDYGNYFSAAGYGENRPIAPNTTLENQAKNRRIEISIVLRDSAITDLINSYLTEDNPSITVTP